MQNNSKETQNLTYDNKDTKTNQRKMQNNY